MMPRKISILVSVVVLLPILVRAAFHQQAPEKGEHKIGKVARKELEKLQGSWFQVAVELDGKEIAGEDKESLFIVRGNVVVLKKGTAVGQVAMLKLVDPIGNPKKMDLVITDGHKEGMTFFAIYKLELDKDVFKYCGSVSGRPKDFKARKGEGVYCGTYKRKNKGEIQRVKGDAAGRSSLLDHTRLTFPHEGRDDTLTHAPVTRAAVIDSLLR